MGLCRLKALLLGRYAQPTGSGSVIASKRSCVVIALFCHPELVSGSLVVQVCPTCQLSVIHIYCVITSRRLAPHPNPPPQVGRENYTNVVRHDVVPLAPRNDYIGFTKIVRHDIVPLALAF